MIFLYLPGLFTDLLNNAHIYILKNTKISNLSTKIYYFTINNKNYNLNFY